MSCHFIFSGEQLLRTVDLLKLHVLTMSIYIILVLQFLLFLSNNYIKQL
jgi:hypothetical protein